MPRQRGILAVIKWRHDIRTAKIEKHVKVRVDPCGCKVRSGVTKLVAETYRRGTADVGLIDAASTIHRSEGGY